MDGLLGLAFAMIGMGYILNIERRLKILETPANTSEGEPFLAPQRGPISQEMAIRGIIAVGAVLAVMSLAIRAYGIWVRWSFL